MKYLIIALLSLSVFTCTPTPSEGSFTAPANQQRTVNTTYEVITIDSCQYLLADRKFAHKGNCNNPIHCYNN